MSDLKSEAQKTCGCVGKNPGFNKLTKEDIDSKLASLIPGMWTLVEEPQKLVVRFTTRNWSSAVAFINELSHLAESADISHHPDIHLTMYRQVEVVIWTHATGGLTLSDFVLAKALESIKVDYSPRWLENHPEFARNQK